LRSASEPAAAATAHDPAAPPAPDAASRPIATAAPDIERLELVARSTGGVVSPDRAALWKFDGEPARTPKDTWWWWLVVAAILLPLDIALRRLSS
jgi:hypothetical protein